MRHFNLICAVASCNSALFGEQSTFDFPPSKAVVAFSPIIVYRIFSDKVICRPIAFLAAAIRLGNCAYALRIMSISNTGIFNDSLNSSNKCNF